MITCEIVLVQRNARRYLPTTVLRASNLSMHRYLGSFSDGIIVLDALMQPDKHEEDSDSCDATESELANVSCEQRRAVEGYDSDNEASLIGGTSSGLDQSYNTESLTSGECCSTTHFPL